MSNLKYYVIDSETTGLKAGWHEMTELSAIRADDRVQLTRSIISEYPERASEQALQITGMTIADLVNTEDKIDREETVCQFNKFLEQDGLSPEHRCIVAHNAAFDRRFCHALWESVCEEFPAKLWLCTMKMAKHWGLKVGRKPENKKLPTMLKFAGIPPLAGLHNAESDSRNAYLLWMKSKEVMPDQVKFIERHEHKMGKYG